MTERLRIDLPFDDAIRAALETPPPHARTPVSHLSLVRAADVRPRPMPMIWRERIPAATLTVFAGSPGLGKSTLALTVAADLSKLGLVGIVSSLEDDLASVVRPRLEVAGARLELVHLVPPDMAPVFPRDVDELAVLIRETQASYLILDPVRAHFQPERLVHDGPTLRRLLNVARETRCAIIAVHHTIQSPGDGTAISKIGGPSGGLAGSARAAYLYGYDPADEDRRALACAKINGVELPAALLLEHETIDYAAGGQLVEAGLLHVVGERNMRARDVLSRGKHHSDRDAACAEWLTLFLAAGDDCKRQTQELRREGKAVGFGWQTLLRARITLEVERVRVGFGGDGFWLWRLPEAHPLRAPSEAAA